VIILGLNTATLVMFYLWLSEKAKSGAFLRPTF
jgi:hypothetical protein